MSQRSLPLKWVRKAREFVAYEAREKALDGIRLHAPGGGDGGRGRLRGRWNRAADRRGVAADRRGVSGGRVVAEKADRSRGGGFLVSFLGRVHLRVRISFVVA